MGRLNNEDVASLFARRESSDAKGNNMFIEGPVLYSYGHHFPIALWLADGTLLWNDNSYSTTTAKHKYVAWRELQRSPFVHQENIIGCSTQELKDVIAKGASNVHILHRDIPVEKKNFEEFLGVMRAFLEEQGLSNQKARAMVKKVEAEWQRQMLVRAI